MPEHKVAIVGASGFVGSALCERLFFEGRRDYVAFIHNPGGAARIARLQAPIQTLDLLDGNRVREALAGFSIIVNCSRGDDLAMIRGLRNLIGAAKQNRVRKFIHISSVAIYGNDPAPGSASETYPPEPGDNEYGRVKARQDEMALALERAGVETYILCPSNIAGPYSTFTLNLAKRMAAGPMALVDEGVYPCNLIHVDNLVQAILTAEASQRGAGERYFVNETPQIGWRQYLDDLARLLDIQCAYVPVSREDVLRTLAPAKQPQGVLAHCKIALSGEFRRGLMLMPALRSINDGATTLFNRFPASARQALRERFQVPISIAKQGVGLSLQEHYVRAQVRRVYHSPEKLARDLNYQPALSYERGLETTAAWLNPALSGCRAL